jgi:hypothetical protein
MLMLRASDTRLRFAAALIALGAVAAACSNGANATSGGGGGDLSLSIASPKDGADVSEPFTVKVDASVPLGDPSTGEDHVHLCFDGQSCDTEYQLVYGNSFQVSTLNPGKHTIEASLRNADHSAAGPTAEITVQVTSASAGSGQATASPSNGGGSGYGY